MSTSAAALRARFAERPLICDGATGTMLHAAGNSLDQSLPALSLTDPQLVRAVHDSYVDAGVDVIQTNTFGASRLRLSEYGLGDQVEQINRAAVRIARDAAQARHGILVAGSVAPAVSVHQRRRTPPQARIDALTEQLSVLADAGVDLIFLETFGYLDELLEAVEVAVAAVDVPVIAQATFSHDAHTLSGHTPREVAEALTGMPVAAIGTNCTIGPQRVLAVVRELREHTDLPLTAQPNAGLPRRTGRARFEYDIDSEYFVRYVRQLLDAGTSLVGGCCGTTPTQLAAVVEMAAEHRARTAVAAAPRTEPEPAAADTAPAFAGPDRLVAVELTTDTAADVEQAARLAAELTRAGAAMICIGAGDGLRARISPADLALNLHQRLGVEVTATVTTWDRTIMALQADLLGAHALGLRRIVCETGSPPLLGDYPHVDGVWDVDSIGLVELVARLNEGTDIHGFPLPSRTAFEIGARINPGSRDLARAAARARDKIAAGAQFLITRPVYDAADLERLLEAIGGDLPPLLVAVRPLTDFAEAEYLAHEVPDTHIPERVLTALEKAGPAAAEVGLELAAELVAAVTPLAKGLVITPTRDAVRAVERLVTS
ncbi:homocysteine S-methyltransferase [Pseudonocardia thermophila]|uniref:Homocysteine S-methyltransferase n=1 Tax=Pseudonocardia thermophila TaxID=1848 RepID=A0A1M6UTP3_PSETH|nr:bifunctional homocysteine S-methyltransferase/methylenetetrahydrofolate reductase [Pseudonocardia thermophila]SHK72588.1 homocysteine S-methyltransferase [Pseudonocardia thermophila]